MKNKAILIALALLCAVCCTAQNAYAMTRGVWVWVDNVGSGTCEVTTNNPQGAMPANGYAYLVPGQTYTFHSGRRYSTQYEQITSTSFVPPPGYDVYINRAKGNSTATSYEGSDPELELRIAGPSESYTGRPGTCTSLNPGELFWQIALGNDRNGDPLPPLSLCAAADKDEWSDCWTPRGLSSYWSGLSVSEIFILGMGGVTSVITPISATSYTIALYDPTQVTYLSTEAPSINGKPVRGYARPATDMYTVLYNGLPFIVYRIEKGATNTSLKITRETRQKSSHSDSTAPVVLTEETSIVRTGSWPNCTWTVKDWNLVGGIQQVTKQMVSTSTTVGITESYTTFGPDGQSAKTETRSYRNFWWGYSLYSTRTHKPTKARRGPACQVMRKTHLAASRLRTLYGFKSERSPTSD